MFTLPFREELKLTRGPLTFSGILEMIFRRFWNKKTSKRMNCYVLLLKLLPSALKWWGDYGLWSYYWTPQQHTNLTSGLNVVSSLTASMWSAANRFTIKFTMSVHTVRKRCRDSWTWTSSEKNKKETVMTVEASYKWSVRRHGSIWVTLTSGMSRRFNPFTPKFKKYILPTFLKRNV